MNIPRKRGGPRRPTAAQAAAEAAALQAALAWPSFPEPPSLDEAERGDLLAQIAPTGDVSERVVPAWTYNASLREVVHGCFSVNQHSTRSHTRTTTQTPGGPWFRTAKEAAEALAWAIARDCAATMRDAMERIAQIRAGGAGK